jgi:molybdopterin-guanine dinucleotide biosynthesis protein A
MLTSRPVDPPIEPFDPFFNANTMDDLAQAERLAALDGNPSER